jgi:hypothetical protein
MAPMPDADTRCSSRYSMPIPDANSGRYPMPLKLKQNKQSFVLKMDIVLIVGLTAKN